MVTIKREDGQVFTVKATMFCASDLDYFKSHGLKLNESSLTPAPAISAAPADTSPATRGGAKGKFYLAIDDAVSIYINGIEAVKVDKATTATESGEIELKAGDRVVAQLINRGGPRFLMLLFVSLDRQTSISFLHTNFKILRDPDSQDFAPADLQSLNRYAKQITNKHTEPLPFKCHSENVWGDADLTATGTVITQDMFRPLPP